MTNSEQGDTPRNIKSQLAAAEARKTELIESMLTMRQAFAHITECTALLRKNDMTSNTESSRDTIDEIERASLLSMELIDMTLAPKSEGHVS